MRVEQDPERQSRVAAALGLVILFALAFRLHGEGTQARLRQRFAPGKAAIEPFAVQMQRAAQRGRGRNALNPVQIPSRGWKDILVRVYHEAQDDRLLAVAAGVVFFSLLAVVPAITALVSSYGLMADLSTIAQHLSFAASVMPSAAFDIVQDQVARIVSKGDAKLTLAFVTGLAVAMWSANAGMKAVFDGLNVVYDEEEKRSFIRLNVISLAFTAGAILLLLAAIGVVVVFPLALAFFGLGTMKETAVQIVRWPAMFVVLVFALSLLYRYGPSRRSAQWRWLSVGSVFGAIAWVGASLLFSWYLANFANYDATYGSLGAVIGLMMWMWLSVIAVLLGAELNAEIEHQTARDSTTGAEKPLGMRGATMADTVGAAAD